MHGRSQPPRHETRHGPARGARGGKGSWNLDLGQRHRHAKQDKEPFTPDKPAAAPHAGSQIFGPLSHFLHACLYRHCG